MEVLSWTLTLVGREAPPPAPRPAPPARRPSVPRRCRVFDGARQQHVEAALLERAALVPGDRLEGPALVVEDQTTTVVSAGFVLSVDARGYLVLERAADRPGGSG